MYRLSLPRLQVHDDEALMLPAPPKNLEEQWSHDYCAHLRIEHSGFEPWPGTLRRVP